MFRGYIMVNLTFSMYLLGHKHFFFCIVQTFIIRIISVNQMNRMKYKYI